MKYTHVETVMAPADITVEEGGGWKFVTLTSPGRAGRLLRRYCPCPAQSSTTPESGEYARPLARNASYRPLARDQRRNTAKTIWQRPDNGFGVLQEMALPHPRKTEASSQMTRHTSSERLVNGCQLRERENALFYRLLCYPIPAAPLS